ncbi:hypothetical protein KC19_12G059700 [Ceratodon purpureus]|uniref:Uncharacterized protein n=1 Tax=Ceratodon purpureus TaxID=3225 RepID=A0A8T0G455_CERPU|nr:hypothetical protein KC19_12G059700 [Ceratodon purpureus]
MLQEGKRKCKVADEQFSILYGVAVSTSGDLTSVGELKCLKRSWPKMYVP